MEGACVYINENNNPSLIMYKEYINNKVLFVLYSNCKLYYQFITSKLLTNIIPKYCVHILTSLPFDYYSLHNTLKIWKYSALYGLIYYETKREKNYLSKNNFNDIFKLNL
tara:strand:+ start:380 stop:709 length:330 start_codon:yes stop_codon:yes gene_type:complete